ncbi:glyoxalase [Maribacter sp. ACAM166]|nr:glyoxalase [Maribacter sp. ACAM166]
MGITVPKIDKAVKFYSEVMGWYVIMSPSKVKKEADTAIGQMCIDVFGDNWEEFEIAHMSTSDGIGIELFSFPHGVKEAPEFNPFRTGLFHFCVQDPNIEDLIEKIVAHGGKQRMPIRSYYPNDKPYKMCYVEDPFGIVFEIYTHSYELTYSSGAYSN